MFCNNTFSRQTSNIFSEEEFSRRLTTLRGYMSENDIGAVVFTSYHNINYYSGFIYCYFGRTYGLVITPENSVSISAGIDGGQPWRRGAANNVTYTDWQRDNFYYAVREALKEENVPPKAKLGLEFDHVSVDNLEKYNAAFPDSPKVDVGRPTMRMRMIKSPEEIAVIRQGARIADIGGSAVTSVLTEGIPEHEVALESTRAMVREIARVYPQSDIMDSK